MALPAESDVVAGLRTGRPTSRGLQSARAKARGSSVNKVAAGPRAGRDVGDADTDTLNGDDSTIIVPDNETPEVLEELFEGNGNGPGKRRRNNSRRRSK
ncbi:MAG: hypothetical protein KAY37_09955 [Phycisphaerae bacterium]|nr:hypothetical protein [Phycisphaerae bacterium]